MSAPDQIPILPDLVVSRETENSLRQLVGIVAKWTRHINLVSSGSLDDIWTRHVLDSAQLFRYLPRTASHWVDLGSGGGFPGLVLSIIAKELFPELKVTFVESDQRKATFLRTASRELGLVAVVQSARIEHIQPLAADVLTARALGSLTQLLDYAHLHLAETGLAIFPKGRTADQEIQSARQNWRFDLTAHASMTDVDAQILRIENISHV